MNRSDPISRHENSYTIPNISVVFLFFASLLFSDLLSDIIPLVCKIEVYERRLYRSLKNKKKILSCFFFLCVCNKQSSSIL